MNENFTSLLNTFFDSIGPDIFEDGACRRLILSLYHKEPACTICGGFLPQQRHARFWENKRSFCGHCGRRFFPGGGTILSSSKLNPRQIVLLGILLKMGMKSSMIASIIGCERHTIARWEKRFFSLLKEFPHE